MINVSNSFGHLTTWSPAVWCFSGRFRGCGRVGKVYCWAQALRLKGCHRFLCAVCASCLCTEDEDGGSQLPSLAALVLLLLAATPPHHNGLFSLWNRKRRHTLSSLSCLWPPRFIRQQKSDMPVVTWQCVEVPRRDGGGGMTLYSV